MANLTPTPGWDEVFQLETDTPVLGGPGGPDNLQAQALLNRTAFLEGATGSSKVGHTAAGTGAVATTVEGKLRETVSISDYASFQEALDALAGVELTGYDTEPKNLDLLGQEITITTDVFVPINVTLINGTISGSGRLIWRNPFLANTGLRGFTEYWPFMKGGAKKCKFNCLTIINVYIGAVFDDCSFNPLVMVNSNSLWTEFNNFNKCFFSSNATYGFALLLDGNNAGTSVYSTGSGVGTADGSFGYNNFLSCKGDAASGSSMMRLVSNAVLYNALIQFNGYQRGTTGAYFDIVNGRIGQSNFSVNIETFGASGNVIAVSAGEEFWYNTGSIQSASPQATFSQNATADLRGNEVYVVGCVLQDGSGSTVFQGDTYRSTITGHLLKRSAPRLVPAVSIYLPTANQSFSSNTTVKVSLTAEDFDAAGSASGGTVTPKVAGYYQVELALVFAATATAQVCRAHIYKNGAAYKTNGVGPVGASMRREVSALVYCDGDTDTIEAYAFVFDNGGSPQIVFGSTVSYMTAVLVRPG